MKEIPLSTALICMVVAAFEALLLRDGTRESSSFLVVLTSGLVIASPGLAWLRRGFERSWWRGFAVGAWSYVALTMAFDERASLLRCLDWIDSGRARIWKPDDRGHVLTAISALLIQASGVIGGVFDLAIVGFRRGMRRGGSDGRIESSGAPIEAAPGRRSG